MSSIYDSLKQVDASALLELITEFTPTYRPEDDDEYGQGEADGINSILSRLEEIIADA